MYKERFRSRFQPWPKAIHGRKRARTKVIIHAIVVDANSNKLIGDRTSVHFRELQHYLEQIPIDIEGEMTATYLCEALGD